MSELQKILDQPYGTRPPLEQCISDAVTLEDERDGDYTLIEQAAQELARLRSIEKAAKLVVRRRDVGNLLEAIDKLKTAMRE
jgi:hypothetical protein